MISFCSGVTLPKTSYSKAAFSTSSFDKPAKDINFSAPSIPASLAIWLTVLASSPEITLILTLLSLNHLKVLTASSRIWSCKTIKAIGSTSPSTFSPVIGLLPLHKTRTLKP